MAKNKHSKYYNEEDQDICPNCNGAGYSSCECEECGGTGHYEPFIDPKSDLSQDTEHNPLSKGTVQASGEYGQFVCNTCQGEGTLRCDCESCGGLGIVERGVIIVTESQKIKKILKETYL